jgi:eukaryotic-like serine/threonine-protein kinase
MLGQTISHYRVTKMLGKGAMGEVYLSEDIRLKRHAALKVLAEGNGQDAETFRRFKIEAEAAARLNHPNIATLYTVEEADGRKIIAMEYIEGTPLRDCMCKTGLELDTFLDWFLPLAGALAHAHERNVIHRDIKPANIIVTRDGMPKILDFGLARIMRDGEDRTGCANVDECLTQIGTIMGSPPYMSPEQASGTTVDCRTDIFSLGIVMYEALTGQRPFTGKTIQDIITSVLKDDPGPVVARRPGVPYLVDHIVGKALQKDRRNRYQTAQDMVNDLQTVKRDRSASQKTGTAGGEWFDAPPSRAPRRSTLFQRVLVGGLLLVTAVLGGLVMRGVERPVDDPPRRFFRIPLEGVASSVTGGGPAISPDGRRIAYVQEDALWMMNLATGQAVKIPDAVDVEGQPFWSPDSRHVCYLSNMGRTIMKMAVADNQSVTLCDVSALGYIGDGTWSDDGRIVFDLWGGDWTRGLGLMAVSPDGDAMQSLMPPDSATGITYQAPSFLPQDRGLLYVKVHPKGHSELMVKTDGTERSLVKNAEGRIFDPLYCPSGHLLYQVGLAERYGIWAVPFSLDRLEVTGTPFLVAENGTCPSVANDGTLTFMTEPPFTQQLNWLDRQGQILSTVGPALPGTQIGAITLSADQTMVAMDGFDMNYEEVWLVDIARSTRSRMTFSSARDADATWSPDGRQLVYASERDGTSDLFLQDADPGAAAVRLVTGKADTFNPDWSRDGRFLAYEQISAETKRDIWYLPLGKDGKPGDPPGESQATVFLKTPFDETMPQISPDGRHIAYMSDISGRWEVYVRPFPHGGGERQVSVRGGGYPRWSTRGDELFYVEGKALMSARVHTNHSVSFDIPVKLFEWRHLGLYFTRRFDPSADARRFLAVNETSTEKRSLNIVEHWDRASTEGR